MKYNDKEMAEDRMDEEDLDDKFNIDEYKDKLSHFIQSHNLTTLKVHNDLETNDKTRKESDRNNTTNNNNNTITDIASFFSDLTEVIPPENFSPVIGEIYRSSFPRIENFKFLRDRLKLKSILVLIPEEYPPENVEFLNNSGIQLFQIGMSGNKEPFINLPSDLLTRALEIVLDPKNQPILIHCNRGKHRTGCLIGCIRKLQNWSLTMIFDEYRRFAFPKARALDQQFIEMYEDEEIKTIAYEKGWLPLEW